MQLARHHFIYIAPVVSVLFYFLLSHLGLADKPALTAAITLLTVIWWVSEAIPIPATSLVPFALFPLFGIVDHKGVASALGSHIIVLLMGAFILSKAIEKSGAHQRLAVYMLRLIGVTSGRRLVLGFMVTAAFLSMWISNTATTLIMLPIALAILTHINDKKLKVALILGIAYAASIGGVATPIGTPPNVIFLAVYEEYTGKEFGFLRWMKLGVPIVVIVLPLMALWLTRRVKLTHAIQLPELHDWKIAETRTLWIFAATALAWITRSEPFGGWSTWFDLPLAGDSTVALFAVVMMFLVSDGKGGRLMDWQTALTIPWGMLLLFAGGITIAKGFMSSGLSQLLGDWLTSLSGMPIILVVLIICLVVTYLTEITSNTATATLLMPILAVAATSSGYPPTLLMIPAAICASCAFMLPVATAPNAIAYGTGEIDIKDMVKEGAILSFMVSCFVAVISYFYLT